MKPLAGTSGLTRSQRAQAAVIAAAGYPTVALLGWSLRWTVSGYEHFEALERAGQPPIFAFWHGRILSATYFWRRRGIVVMTSANFDGEWIARIIERFGYGTARGSTSRGGRRALAQLRRDMRAGRPAAFTVDGPRGPARSVQPGAVWLARLTGHPILPFHIEAAPCWTAGSWDRAQIPTPFARAAIVVGRPIPAPPPADEERIESTRRSLEQALHDAARRALRLIGRDDRRSGAGRYPDRPA